jgi:hypothetical protein
MPYIDKAKQKQYQKDLYQRTKGKYRERRKQNMLKNREYVFEILKQSSCVDCGESDPIVLDFDHRDPSTKYRSVCDCVRDCALKRVKEEIAKCDVVCANCHRRRTAKQFGWHRSSWNMV